MVSKTSDMKFAPMMRRFHIDVEMAVFISGA